MLDDLSMNVGLDYRTESFLCLEDSIFIVVKVTNSILLTIITVRSARIARAAGAAGRGRRKVLGVERQGVRGLSR